jgi:site-specific recombinase XerD
MSKRTRKVNWSKTHKQWVKTYKGKKYWLGQCPGISDRDCYNRAVERFEEIKKQVDAGNQVDSTRGMGPKSPRKKSKKKQTPKRSYNPRRVSTCVRRFIKHKRDIATASGGEEITLSRVQNIQNRLQHFNDFFADYSLGEISERDITRWQKAQLKRVENGEIAPTTLRQDFLTVRQLYKWSYQQHIINNQPRNLEELTKRTKKQRTKAMRSQTNLNPHLLFSKSDIQTLYKSCDTDSMDISWLKRGDTEVEMLRVALLLALNTGMTQQDLSDLTVGELFFKMRPPRLKRYRSKTNVETNVILWRETVKRLKDHCRGKKKTDLVLLRRDGRPLVTQSVVKGQKTGGRSDVLGAAFRRLVQRVFGKDDKRRFHHLRSTVADLCKQRLPGTQDLYLSHRAKEMSSFYTRPAQKQFDTMMTYLEKDLGFSKDLMKLPKGRSKP